MAWFETVNMQNSVKCALEDAGFSTRRGGEIGPNAGGTGSVSDSRRAPPSNGNGHRDEAATNKQIQYLLSIGKRMRLSTAALEKEVADILGQNVGIYDLSKKQAGIVIDQLSATSSR